MAYLHVHSPQDHDACIYIHTLYEFDTHTHGIPACTPEGCLRSPPHRFRGFLGQERRRSTRCSANERPGRKNSAYPLTRRRGNESLRQQAGKKKLVSINISQ